MDKDPFISADGLAEPVHKNSSFPSDQTSSRLIQRLRFNPVGPSVYSMAARWMDDLVSLRRYSLTTTGAQNQNVDKTWRCQLAR
jgi:hypothetical protein